MKKKITLIICSLLFAITGVKATEYTTVDELTSNYFVLTSVVDNMAKTFSWNGAKQMGFGRGNANRSTTVDARESLWGEEEW